MIDIEKRARVLLGAEYQRDGREGMAGAVRRGKQMLGLDDVAIRAIIAALTPPEGYVLVPVEPTEDLLMFMGGHDDASRRRAYNLMLAARPEVKP